MVVLLFGIELEILKEVSSPERGKLMAEAATVYRDRGRCLQALARPEAAQSDLKRAAQMDREARQLAEGQIELINRFREPVTVVIDGVSYRLAVGESKVITRAAGTFRYELPTTGQVSTGQVEAGKIFGLQIR